MKTKELQKSICALVYKITNVRIHRIFMTKILLFKKLHVKKTNWYNGQSIPSWVYGQTYNVIQVNGDRIVIGKGQVVTAAISKRYLYHV